MVAITPPSSRTVPDYRSLRTRWQDVVGFEDVEPDTSYLPQLPERIVRWFYVALGVGQKAEMARMREELELLSRGAGWRYAYQMSWFVLELALLHSDGGRDIAELHRRLDRMVAGWEARQLDVGEAKGGGANGDEASDTAAGPQ